MKRFKSASEIRSACIGYGPTCNMGKLHFSYMIEAGIKPVAVCDVNQEALETAKKDFPDIDVYSSADEMLSREDINLVTVILPHNLHSEFVIKCLNAGKNTVVEKPMAITTKECDKMMAAAKKNKCLLSVFHNRHWDPFIITAVDMVKKQKLIGDIIRINAHLGGYHCPGAKWRGSKSISGGILYDMGAHLLEYCFQLIDSPVTEVSGFTHTGFWADQSKWKNDTNEDDANIVVRFKSGQWITMNSSSIDSYPGNKDRGWMEITGTKGTYIIDPGAWKLITKQEGKHKIKTGPELPGNWADYYKNLANHLVNGEPLVITAELGRKIIHIIELGYQSAKKGRTLKPVHK